MRYRFRLYHLVVGALVVLAGCGVFDHDSPTSVPATVSVTVMTRNVYVGTDIDLDAFEPTQVLNTFLRTDFGERAKALAAEIAAANPHFVGLQEVALFRFQVPSDPATPARITFADYLLALTLELAAKGLHYEPVAVVENLDIEFPVDLPPHGFVDLRLTDRDVILARSDVVSESVLTGNFSATRVVTISFDGEQTVVPVPRGFVVAEGTVEGVRMRVASAHLETGDDLGTQQAQARELIEVLRELRADRPLPEILLGDFNSPAPPAVPSGVTYQELIDAGFVDTDPGEPGGFTCCHPPTLVSDRVLLSSRIDLVLVRNVKGATTLRPSATEIVGDEPGDRITVSSPSGPLLLWPSDHAGVVAQVRIDGD